MTEMPTDTPLDPNMPAGMPSDLFTQYLGELRQEQVEAAEADKTDPTMTSDPAEAAAVAAERATRLNVYDDMQAEMTGSGTTPLEAVTNLTRGLQGRLRALRPGSTMAQDLDARLGELETFGRMLARPDAAEIATDFLAEREWGRQQAETAQREREAAAAAPAPVEASLPATKGGVDSGGMDALHKVMAAARAAAPEAPSADPDAAVEAAREKVTAAQTAGHQAQPAPEREASPASQERKEQSPLVEQVVKAGRGTAIIHTDLPGDLPLLYRGSQEGRTRADNGLNTFGDGSSGTYADVPRHLKEPIGGTNPVKDSLDAPETAYTRDVVEAVAFVPATEDVYETQTKTIPGGFLRGDQKVPHQVKVGERPRLITNPETGGQEAAVKLQYAYNLNLAGGDADRTEKRLGLPAYLETGKSRTGNRLIVEVTVPQSLANTLRTGLEEASESGDPERIAQQTELIRGIVQGVVINLGGMSEEAWDTGADLRGRTFGRSKPPYESLPASHRMFIFDPQTEPRGRKIMVAQRMGGPAPVQTAA